ncbi:hypothetical protein BN2476_340035 [Paraburkholderia piptadeniae]|uniref:Uncharacterized protein n=1 Tax=Paraburkholderia piptadeniae TaxID=1701573 RepID=A0A1N7S7P4_9BURK|nr:hypothetical protein BN2476_340035 [Paraburkholderia piptadeniae]
MDSRAFAGGPDGLKNRGVVRGKDYPQPVVDHAKARRATLARCAHVERALLAGSHAGQRDSA